MSGAVFLFALIIIAVIAAAVAFALQIRERSRQEIVDRTLGVTSNADVRRAIRRGLGADEENSLRARMLKKAPSVWAQNETVQQRLVKAGYDGPIAPLVYSMVRVVALVVIPLLAFVLLPKDSFLKILVGVSAAGMVGLLLPPFVLLRLESRRQEQIRRPHAPVYVAHVGNWTLPRKRGGRLASGGVGLSAPLSTPHSGAHHH